MNAPAHARSRGAAGAGAGLWIPAAFLAVGLLDDLVGRGARVGPDFAVYHRAAVRFLAGEPLYRLEDGHLCFKYSPAAALLFAPFAALPARAGEVLLNGLSALALLRLMRFGAGLPGSARGAGAHLLAALFALPLTVLLFYHGQVDALLAVLAVESERCADRRPARSGLLWCLAALFKPPLLVLAAPALLSRQWRRLAWAAAAAALLLGAATLRYGPVGGVQELSDWRGLLAATTPPLTCIGANQSAFAVACLAFGPAPRPALLRAGLAVAALAAMALAIPIARILRRNPEQGRLAASLAAIYASSFLSPLGWRVNLVSAIPLVYVAAGGALCARGVARVACAASLAAWIAIGNAMSDRLLGSLHQVLVEARFYGLCALAIALAALWSWALGGGTPPASAPRAAEPSPPPLR